MRPILKMTLQCEFTRPDGTRCRAYATRSGLCAGHSGLGAVANPRESQRRSAQARRQTREQSQEDARRKDLSLRDALRERATAERDAILDALFAPLDDPEASAQDKHHAALRILERLLGRPSEAIPDAPADDTGPIDWAELAEEIRGLPEADRSQEE
jgi:hypothetical protein